MKRLFCQFAFLGILSFATAGYAQIEAVSPTQPRSLKAIADDYEITLFEYFPEYAVFYGKTNVPQDRFSDGSVTAQKAWQEKEDKWLDELNQLDIETFINTPAYVTYQLLKESLENAKAVRICHENLWAISPLFGWHVNLGIFADNQPLSTPLQRADALKRWNSVPKVAEDQINNLKEGIKQGFTAPKPLVESVIAQLEIMLDAPIEQSPFFVMVKKSDDDAFKKEMATIIDSKINAALTQYHDFLTSEYLNQARESIGLSALPEGEACYLAKIKQSTTLNLSPQTIYQFGENHMVKIQKEISQIGLSEFSTINPTEIFKLSIKNSKVFQSEQDIIDYNLNALAKAKLEMNHWFYDVPKALCEIKPYAIHRAKVGAPGEYHPPSEDGSTPGIYYINTFEPENKSRLDQEAILFHELLPGHHLQIALSQEYPTYHAIDRYLGNSGYSEGWALYSERLADEMGLYKDNISRLGMLSNEAMRTARLVIDPGIHSMGWSRQQAITYMKTHTALSDHIIEGEIDRYIMMPGQATSYMLGKREIDNLRDYAKMELQETFDIRDFHRQILKQGTITLPMLKANIISWIETQKNALEKKG